MRFGVSPIAWSNDDMPELGGDTPLESILGDIRDLGFEGVELGGRFPRQPGALKALLGAHGLDLIGGWYSGSLLTSDPQTEIAALQDHLGLLQAMGSTVFVFAETSNAVHGDRATALNATPQLGDADWGRFGERTTAVADYVAAQGLRFAYHHHLGTAVERPGDLDAFLRHTGASVGLTLDTGHAVAAGIDPVAVIRDHPERIAHVHCKDVRGRVLARVREEGRSFLDGVLAGMFTTPGDGEVDFDAVMRALHETGYCGWIVVEAEQDPALADPRTYAEQGLDHLRSAAARAGLG